jgi:hypothetical protein
MPTRVLTWIENPHKKPTVLYWTETGNIVELTEPSDSQLKKARRQILEALDQRLAKRRLQAGYKTT